MQTAELLVADRSSRYNFVSAVSLSGDRVVVGACDDDQLGATSGAACVFEYDVTSWRQTAMLLASDVTANDWFGHSVVKLHAQLTHFH